MVIMGPCIPVDALNEKYKAQAGEEVTVIIDLDDKNNNAYNYEAELKYDNKVLEVLTKDSFENTSANANIVNDVTIKDNKVTIKNDLDSVTKDMVKITFKVKKDIDTDKTVVKLTNIKSEDGKVKLDDREVEILLSEKKVMQPKKIIIGILIAVVGILVIAMIVINVGKNSLQIKNVKLVNTKLSVIAGIMAVIALVLSIMDAKKEISYDLKIKNNEASAVTTPTTEPTSTKTTTQKTTEKKQDKTTTTTKKAEEEQEYLKIVKSEVSDYYPQKGETIEILYTIETNIKDTITALWLGEEKYAVQKTKDNIYKVSYQVGKNSGLETITLTKVDMTKQALELKDSVVVDVLKDKPTLKEFTYTNEEEQTKLNIAFDDPDGAIKRGTIAITDMAGNKVSEMALTIGKTEYDLRIAKNGDYHIIVDIDADLDTNALNEKTGAKNDYTQTIKDAKVTAFVDYELAIKDVELVAFDDENLIATLQFTSMNYLNKDIKEVVIQGTKYAVSKVNGHYRVQVKVASHSKQDIEITSVILEDGKEVSTEEDIWIFKDRPEVENYEVNAEGDTIKGSFNVTNQDTITKMYVVLHNDSEDIKKEITITEGNTYSFEFADLEEGDYQVKVVANYDILDTLVHENVELANKDVHIAIVASIKLNTTKTNMYPYRSVGHKLYYEITDNTNRAVTKVIINDHEYDVTLKDGSYEVEYRVKDTSGIEEIAVSKIIYGEAEVAAESHDKLDVLKMTPHVENYIVKEDYDDSQATFTFNILDAENALVRDAEGNLVDAYLQVGENTYPIINNHDKLEVTVSDLAKDQELDVKVYATYDLDTNELNDITGEANRQTAAIFTRDFKPIDAKELKVIDLKVWNNEWLEDVYFAKNERFYVTFKTEQPENVTFDIRYATISGHTYDLIKDENGVYKTTEPIVGFGEAGIKKVVVEEVILEDGEEIDIVDVDAKIDVIKSKPTVENFSFKEDYMRKTATFTFEINDADGALDYENGALKNVYAVIGEEKVKITDAKGTITVTFHNIPRGVESDLLIKADLDLDTDTLNNGEDLNTLTEEILYEGKFMPIDSSKIVVDDLHAISKDNTEAREYFYKKETMRLAFQASLPNSYVEIAKVNIDGKEYNVSLEGDEYISEEIPGYDEFGLKEITVTSLILSDNEVVTLNKTLKIEVLKSHVELKANEVTTNFDNSLTIEYTLTDEDGVLKKDSEGNLVNAYLSLGDDYSCKISKLGHGTCTFADKKVPAEGRSFVFGVTGDADYDTDALHEGDNEFQVVVEDGKLVSGKNLSTTVIYASEFKTIVNLSNYNLTDKLSVKKEYFYKGRDMYISFKATKNNPHDLVKATINGTKYDLTKNGDTYTAKLPSYSQYGLQTLTVQDVELANGEVYDTEDYTFTFEILKNYPQVKNLKYYKKVNHVEKGVTYYDVTFEFDFSDNDEALIRKEDGTYESFLITYANHIRHITTPLGDHVSETFTNIPERLYMLAFGGKIDVDTNAIRVGDNEVDTKTTGDIYYRVGIYLPNAEDLKEE